MSYSDYPQNMIPTEEQEQAKFIEWLNLQKIYFEIGLEGIWLPNPHTMGSQPWRKQKKANMAVLKKMKAQGLKKGVADVKVYLPKVVLHVELKRKKGGVQSEEQKINGLIIERYSYAKYRVCKGFDEAVKFVEENM